MDPKAAQTILTTIVRNCISAAVGGLSIWASKRGFDISSELPILIGLLAAFIVNLTWGIGERLLKKWKLTAALQLDRGATHKELDYMVKQVPVLTRISEAITVPR